MIISIITFILEGGPGALIVHCDSLSTLADRTQARLSAGEYVLHLDSLGPGCLSGPQGTSQHRDGLLGPGLTASTCQGAALSVARSSMAEVLIRPEETEQETGHRALQFVDCQVTCSPDPSEPAGVG